MAGYALTSATTMQCPHGGQVQVVPSNTRAKGDAFLLTAADTFTIVGCPFTLPPGSAQPLPDRAVDRVGHAGEGRRGDTERRRHGIVHERCECAPGTRHCRRYAAAGEDPMRYRMNPVTESVRYPFAVDAGGGRLAQEPIYAAHVEQMIKQVLLHQFRRADQSARLRLWTAPHGVRAQLRRFGSVAPGDGAAVSRKMAGDGHHASIA